MSHGKINIKTIVEDFLHDRLSDMERKSFLQYYTGLAREDKDKAELIFDEIQTQVDALSDTDLHRFLSKLDSANMISVDPQTKSFSKILSFVKYAAAIVVVLGMAFMYSRFFNEADKLIRYSAVEDEFLLLPDSSSVLLKAGSDLSYRSSYGEANRSITLNGEAFFDVKPDSEKAFVVSSASGFYTRVLGTSFLMDTRLKSERVEVKTGRVQVGRAAEIYSVLTAGDTLYLDNSQVVVNRKVQAEEAALLHFNNETLETVTAALTKRFSKKVILDESVPNGLKYTATFSSDQNLEDILKVLCDLHGLSYNMKTNPIIISK